MSEPTNAQLAEKAAAAIIHVDGDRDHMCQSNLKCEVTLEIAFLLRRLAQRLEASPSTETIIEWMARAIFNQHNRLTPEDSTWHVVPEQTREIFRGIARHELEIAQKV